MNCEKTGQNLTSVYGYSEYLYQVVAERLTLNQDLRPSPTQLVEGTRIAGTSAHLATADTTRSRDVRLRIRHARGEEVKSALSCEMGAFKEIQKS